MSIHLKSVLLSSLTLAVLATAGTVSLRATPAAASAAADLELRTCRAAAQDWIVRNDRTRAEHSQTFSPYLVKQVELLRGARASLSPLSRARFQKLAQDAAEIMHDPKLSEEARQSVYEMNRNEARQLLNAEFTGSRFEEEYSHVTYGDHGFDTRWDAIRTRSELLGGIHIAPTDAAAYAGSIELCLATKAELAGYEQVITTCWDIPSGKMTGTNLLDANHLSKLMNFAYEEQLETTQIHWVKAQMSATQPICDTVAGWL